MVLLPFLVPPPPLPRLSSAFPLPIACTFQPRNPEKHGFLVEEKRALQASVGLETGEDVDKREGLPCPAPTPKAQFCTMPASGQQLGAVSISHKCQRRLPRSGGTTRGQGLSGHHRVSGP